MKKTWIQYLVILALSTVLGLGFNYFFGKSLPVFGAYKPEPPKIEEDLTQYYDEMDVETLKSLLESKMVILLDARKADLYRAGHIPGAVSLPIWDFKAKYVEKEGIFEEGKTIVIYCIGIHCTDSGLLAKELHKKGHQEIFVYKGGIEEWEALGNPVKKPGEGDTENER